MKKINRITKFRDFLPFGNSAGFTMIEVLASMVILSVGILGLASSINSVTHFQRYSKDLTSATMHTTAKLEEIKRMGTDEPTGGAFGFLYLVNDTTGYLNGYAAPDDWNRVSPDDTTTYPGFSQVAELTVFPAGAQATQDFTDPSSIDMVDVQVTTTWVDDRGNSHEVQAGTVIHKRRFF